VANTIQGASLPEFHLRSVGQNRNMTISKTRIEVSMTTAPIGPFVSFADDLIAALCRFIFAITQPDQDVQEMRRAVEQTITIGNDTANLVEGFRRRIEDDLDKGVPASNFRGVLGELLKSSSESTAALLTCRDLIAKMPGSGMDRRPEALEIMERLIAGASDIRRLFTLIQDAANAQPTPEMLARAESVKNSPGVPLHTAIAEFRAEGLL
jgi:hypothetical protein